MSSSLCSDHVGREKKKATSVLNCFIYIKDISSLSLSLSDLAEIKIIRANTFVRVFFTGFLF